MRNGKTPGVIMSGMIVLGASRVWVCSLTNALLLIAKAKSRKNNIDANICTIIIEHTFFEMVLSVGTHAHWVFEI